LGIFCCVDNVLAAVNLPNSLRRHSIEKQKAQFQILSGLPAYMPIDPPKACQ
jgi:hypothetical protein